MTPAEFLLSQMDDHAAVLAATRDAVAAPFQRLVEACVTSLEAGGKILFFGNGGSAADAQHLAAELLVRYRINRKALAAIALTTDTSTLTACANDYTFEGIFSRQVEALARPGDVLIGISTSGKSPNVVKALQTGKEMGCVAAGLSGGDGGVMKDLCEPLLVVPSKIVARIQEMHILIGHALCDRVEVLAGGPGTQAH
jgi:D-sedoheptulose 7-phosphate isomerase